MLTVDVFTLKSRRCWLMMCSCRKANHVDCRCVHTKMQTTLIIVFFSGWKANHVDRRYVHTEKQTTLILHVLCVNASANFCVKTSGSRDLLVLMRSSSNPLFSFYIHACHLTLYRSVCFTISQSVSRSANRFCQSFLSHLVGWHYVFIRITVVW